jgi:hypothetical protein
VVFQIAEGVGCVGDAYGGNDGSGGDDDEFFHVFVSVLLFLVFPELPRKMDRQALSNGSSGWEMQYCNPPHPIRKALRGIISSRSVDCISVRSSASTGPQDGSTRKVAGSAASGHFS